MNNLNEILLNELPKLEEAGNQFLEGKLSKLDFKKISGGFGVYAERDGKSFILRFRIPGGMISTQDLQFIYEQAKSNHLDYIHLTTRQCIQIQDIPLTSVCHIIREGIGQGLYTRGSGGNYPRNVAMSPLAGISPLEPFDILPYALASNLHLLEKIYTYHLPRKLKIAFSNTPEDTAHCTVQDMGFMATSKDERPFFKLYLGGGLGKDPRCGLLYPSLIKPCDVIYAIEALLALFVKEGNYENHHKARVRYIVEKLGEEGFLQAFSGLLAVQMKNEGLKLFPTTSCDTFPEWTPTLALPRIVAQKQPGYYSVYYHPIGGHFKLSMLEKLLSRLSSLPNASVRLTMTEGLYIINLTEAEALEFLELTNSPFPSTQLTQSISCIGVPTCQMGIQNSQDMLRRIISYFESHHYTPDILPPIYISGCPNSCATHQIGKLGLVGKKKKVDGNLCDVFTLYIGGSFHEGETKLGTPLGDILKEHIPLVLYHLATQIEASGENFSTWISKNMQHTAHTISKYLI